MWGKLLGVCFGFMFGRWLGAIFGFWLGHMFDKSLKQDFDKVGGFQGFFKGDDLHQRQALFFSSCFAVMGHIAKSNGRVSETHIKAATLFMDEMGLHGEDRQEAQNAFRYGKGNDFELKGAVNDFKEVFSRRYDLLQLFLEIQIQMVFSDGHLAPQEVQLLQKVSQLLGISNTHFRFILKRYQAEFKFREQRAQHGDYQRQKGSQTAPQSESITRMQALAVLGLTEQATDKDVKRAYRKLMSQHHPDKLVSQGLPQHMMEVAKKKSQDIQAAYEFLKHPS
ncbi:co-chaperone DjlA [Pseudoalteromonas sp. MMG012]|uniref:co-chaperone DjlA n=1 Tax=Pseudoalteromonas sp. MMG012 TaxID=2822686 RepID=UPI001B3A77C0|nr:co-chaperone DjlA [Pseudoalteromonas sp. MMG012]MBQ4849140.1 co-chaperone DjlA [Pseudoalteromonas sp. MMG012]